MGILYEERANKEEKTVNYPYSLCMDEGAERHDNRRELGLGIRLGDWGRPSWGRNVARVEESTKTGGGLYKSFLFLYKVNLIRCLPVFTQA